MVLLWSDVELLVELLVERPQSATPGAAARRTGTDDGPGADGGRVEATAGRPHPRRGQPQAACALARSSATAAAASSAP